MEEACGSGRRLLFTTSSRFDYVRDVSGWRARHPWAPASVLHALTLRGWNIKVLTFHENWNPWRVARVLSDYQPDVVVTFFTTALSPVVARRFCRGWAGGPIIFWWNDYYSEIYRDTFGKVAGGLMAVYERLLVRHSDEILTISRYNYQRAEAMGKKVSLIPLCVEPQVFDPTKCALHLNGRFNVLHLGHAHRYRKSHLLTAAMRQLPDDIQLHFVGVVDPEIKAMAPANCVFWGHVSQDDKYGLMNQADAFISSTDQDCAGRYYEYLVMKKPIIAFDGRSRLLFTDGRNALLTRDFARSIRSLEESPELRRRLVENATRDIPVDTPDVSAEKHEAFFLDAIGRYHASRA